MPKTRTTGGGTRSAKRDAVPAIVRVFIPAMVNAPSTPRKRMKEKRIAWLRAHEDELRRLPGEEDDVEDVEREVLKWTGEAMVEAGLYSSNTQPQERDWSLRALVTEIRRRDR